MERGQFEAEVAHQAQLIRASQEWAILGQWYAAAAMQAQAQAAQAMHVEMNVDTQHRPKSEVQGQIVEAK